MYTISPSNNILQGDLIADFSYPVFSDASLSLSSTSGKPEFRSRVTVKSGFVALVSHSCDMVRYEKQNKRPALLFCPLIKIPRNIRNSSGRYTTLRINRVDPSEPKFISLFWYKQSDPLEEDLVIDLSTIQAIPITMLEVLPSKKVLELDEEARGLLQEKLMYHFGRNEKPRSGV